MVSGLLIVAFLGATNLAVYSFIFLRLFRPGGDRIQASSLSDAFGALNAAMKRSDPGLPVGLTWEEAFDRMAVSNHSRQELEAALEIYEAHRFGGAAQRPTDFSEVVRVANMLERTKHGRRN